MPHIPTPQFNRFQFCQLSPRRHLIRFGQEQTDGIHWVIFGERTRDQLVALQRRLASQHTPVPFVIEELATPIPGSLMFSGASVFLGDQHMTEFVEKLGDYLRSLDEGHAPACDYDPFDLGV